MDKNEFKRIWREFRTEVRARQGKLRRDNRTSGSHSIEPGSGVFICGGFTDQNRETSATRLRNLSSPGNDVHCLVDAKDNFFTRDLRRRNIALARQSGRIPLPLEART